MELRKRIGENFEYAALPSTNQEERARALHFMVVGGGPTGSHYVLNNAQQKHSKTPTPRNTQHHALTALISPRLHNTNAGVEFSGTLADYVRQDLRRKYPELMPLVRVSLLQSAQSILTMFDRDLQDRAIRQLQSQGVDVQLGVKVREIGWSILVGVAARTAYLGIKCLAAAAAALAH